MKMITHIVKCYGSSINVDRVKLASIWIYFINVPPDKCQPRQNIRNAQVHEWVAKLPFQDQGVGALANRVPMGPGV